MAEKEYIEREAAINEIEEWYDMYTDSDVAREALSMAKRAILKISAADVRPVVYCKDCHHRDPEDHKCDCGQLERAGCVFPVDDNYWCAHGEKGRKTDERLN